MSSWLLKCLSIDQLEVIKAVIFVLFVLSLMGGIRGLLLDGHKRTAATKTLGRKISIASLIFQTAFTVFIFLIDNEISARQRAELNRQNNELIVLRKNALPRSINVERFAAQLKNASPTKVEIQFVVACSDCESLSFWIAEAFKKAQWPDVKLGRIDPVDRDWVRAVIALHAQSSGISVIVDSPDKTTPDTRTAWGAIDRALANEVGFNYVGYNVSVIGGVDVKLSPGSIRIVIAPKG